MISIKIDIYYILIVISINMESTYTQSCSNIHSKESELDNYVKQLSPLERGVFEIASGHLGSSFSLLHSIGFIKLYENKESDSAKMH